MSRRRWWSEFLSFEISPLRIIIMATVGLAFIKLLDWAFGNILY